MEDGTRLYVFSSSGKALGEVSGCLAVRRLVEQRRELVFDAPDPAARAWVEMGAMRYEFDDTVSPRTSGRPGTGSWAILLRTDRGRGR